MEVRKIWMMCNLQSGIITVINIVDYGVIIKLINIEKSIIHKEINCRWIIVIFIICGNIFRPWEN